MNVFSLSKTSIFLVFENYFDHKLTIIQDNSFPKIILLWLHPCESMEVVDIHPNILRATSWHCKASLDDFEWSWKEAPAEAGGHCPSFQEGQE